MIFHREFVKGNNGNRRAVVNVPLIPFTGLYAMIQKRSDHGSPVGKSGREILFRSWIASAKHDDGMRKLPSTIYLGQVETALV